MAQNETQHYLRTIDIDAKIVANIDNGIIVLDQELRLHHYNKWLELHTGIKESEILGKKLNEVFPSIKAKTLQRKINTALKMDSPTFYAASTSKYLIPIEIKQLKNSGFEYMRQDVSIIPFDQEVSLVALVISDQTNMAHTHAVLESNIEKVRELNAELLKEKEIIDKKILFLKFDEYGKIYDASEALCTLLKHTKENLIGTNFFIYNQESLDESLKEQILWHMEERESYSFEQRAFTLDSKELWFKSSLIPEYDTKGLHLGFILFRENITNAKALERNHEKIVANSRSAAMGEMINMIAHQWRQPLSLINTTLATIQMKHELDQLDDETLTTYFKKIETTTKYLSDTIDDFRDYFKPNKSVSGVNIKELFDKSLFFLKNELAQLNIEYILDVDEELTIVTYKNELLQSLINIIKNSIDAFDTAQENKKLTICVTKEQEHVVIHIEDNAGGIAPEIINKIFEPYFSTKQNKNGTGLGLYMCQTTINEHLHGKLNISSANGKTEAQIELPLSLETIG